MIEGETHFGAPFGSGRLVTPDVWAIIEKLHPPNGSEIGPEEREALGHELAKAEAWLNGCSRPERNIGENGAMNNARGDGRNNFLFGCMADRAQSKPSWLLYYDIVFGYEAVHGDESFEFDNVPCSYKHGVRTGFARDLPYEIIHSFWKEFDRKKNGDRQHDQQMFCGFLESLEMAKDGITTITTTSLQRSMAF